MTKVIVYTREGCHLCENVIAELEKMKVVGSFELATQDITKDPSVFEGYKNIIPVVSIDGDVKLAGAVLSNLRNLNEVLRRAIFSM